MCMLISKHRVWLAHGRRTIELCGLVRSHKYSDGSHDPGVLNDRLLLGLTGTMSESNLLLQRSLEAIARRHAVESCNSDDPSDIDAQLR